VFHLEVLHLKEEISTALERFSEQTAEWKRWANFPLSQETYKKMMIIMELGKKASEDVNNRMYQETAHIDQGGFPLISFWIFFNILTWYITHKAVSLNHRLEMERRLRMAIDHLRSK
jgi:hypothetical protein